MQVLSLLCIHYTFKSCLFALLFSFDISPSCFIFKTRYQRQSFSDSEHCHFCNERVFVLERLSAEGFFFHRKCFKCEVCEETLRLGNYGYIPSEDNKPGKFYCKAHYRKIMYETPTGSQSNRKSLGKRSN